jgi:hypothetical protein
MLGKGAGSVAVLAVGDGDGWTVDCVGEDDPDGDAADGEGAGDNGAAEDCVDEDGVDEDGADQGGGGEDGAEEAGPEEDDTDHGGVDENGPDDGPASVDEVSGGVGLSVGRPVDPRLGAPVAWSRGTSMELPTEGVVGGWVVAESCALNGTKNSRPASASATAANAPSLRVRGPPYRPTDLGRGFPCLNCVNLPPPGRLAAYRPERSTQVCYLRSRRILRMLATRSAYAASPPRRVGL